MKGAAANLSEQGRERPGDCDEPLERILAVYLEARERGELVDCAALMRKHPALADELALFFANEDHVGRLMAPLRAGARPSTLPIPAPSVLPFPAASPAGPDTGAVGNHVSYFGDYELIEVLAEGGMGVIFKARQLSLNRVLALKMVRAGRFATPNDLYRFRLEAEAAAHLDHPQIVPIYEVGEHEGHHYFSMKLVEGGSLADHLGRFADRPRAAAKLVASVARAVHYAHERGILHRDLKPANVLLGGPPDVPPEDRVPMVTDFGLAKWFEGKDAAGVTQSGAIVGTPGYMAPEQAEGRRESITTAIDVHALGVILFELLTGRPPFRSDGMLETLRIIREQEPPRPSDLNPKIAADLDTIVLKCLEKSPGRRYCSALLLAEDLERWLADMPIRARRASPAEHAVKWARRRPAMAGLLLLVVVLAGALTGMATAVSRSWNRERDRQRAAETERTETRERDRRAQEDRYFQGIMAADQALSANDPTAADRLLALCPAWPRNWEWRHLSHRLHPERVTIQGHSGFVCPDFSPETSRVECQLDALSGSIWEADAGPRLRRMHGPDGSAYGAAIDRGGTRIATAGSDGLIKVWDMAGGTLLQLLRGHAGWAAGIAFDPSGRRVAAGGKDGTVRIWDLAGKPDPAGTPASAGLVLRGHAGGVFGVAFNSDGTKLASVGTDGIARLWNLAAPGIAVCEIRAGGGREVFSVAFHPTEGLIATGGADRIVRVWDVSDGHLVREFRAGTARINAIAFSTDGTRIATGGLDCGVNVWDTVTGRRLAAFAGHGAQVYHVAFSTDGTKLVSAAQDATVKLWDLSTEAGVRTYRLEPSAIEGSRGASDSAAVEKHIRWVGGVAFRPGGDELTAAGTGLAVSTWSASSGRLIQQLREGPGVMVALAYSPDGARLAASGTDGKIVIWDRSTSGGAPIEIAGPSEGTASLAYSQDGKLLASGGGSPPAIVQVPRGKLAAGEDEPHAIRLWDAATGRLLRTLPGHVGSIHALAFNHDGTRLASAGFDGIIRLWDVSTDRVRTELKGHAGAVFGLCFSRDGQQLISGGEDRTVRCWQLERGQLVYTLSGHTNWVLGVAISPDGSRIASAGADQTVRVWDAHRGREVLVLRAPSDRVHGVAFSGDGDRLAAASADGIVRVWEAPAVAIATVVP